jgi:hypothetical protein
MRGGRQYRTQHGKVGAKPCRVLQLGFIVT